MAKKDSRIDAYIGNSPDFAKPLLTHLRRLVHQACPAVEEDIKWGFPHFMYKGILCSMAAFKTHCAFGFWQRELVLGQVRKTATNGKQGMGQFGHLKCLADLPADRHVLRYVQEAVALKDSGIKRPKKPVVRRELVVPEFMMSALQKRGSALQTFQ